MKPLTRSLAALAALGAAAAAALVGGSRLPDSTADNRPAAASSQVTPQLPESERGAPFVGLPEQSTGTSAEIADACSTLVGDRVEGVAGIALRLLDSQGRDSGDKAVLCMVRGSQAAASVRNFDPDFVPSDSELPVVWAAVMTSDRYGNVYLAAPDADLAAFGPDSASVPHVVRDRLVFVSQMLDLADLDGVATFYIGWGAATRDGNVDASAMNWTYCGITVTVDDLGHMDAALNDASCGRGPVDVPTPSPADARALQPSSLFR